jgi:RecA/RadA recombinase
MSKMASKKTVATVDSKSLLNNFLKSNKEDHFNYEEQINYRVSSGSLEFDHHLDGGFGPGLHRFVGMNEGGKTSASLEVMKNFLKMPKSKAVYFKAEGRLSDEMIKRCGIKFVFDYEQWEEGTCFVFESNIYETSVDLMRQLVSSNEEKNKYCFVLDSVDGLIKKADNQKTFEESAQVAGGANIAATFMKKMSIALAKRGHIAIFISQVRADIKLDPYSKAPVRQTTATGGNALLHFANWIIEFEPRFGGDNILLNPSNKKMDPKTNPAIGHYAKVVVKKSPNEKTNTRISYPIRYGRTGGNSIWVEKEVVGTLEAWEFIKKAGAWISITEDFREILNEGGFSLPEKVQGENKLFSLIEDDSALCQYLVAYFKKMFSGQE